MENKSDAELRDALKQVYDTLGTYIAVNASQAEWMHGAVKWKERIELQLSRLTAPSVEEVIECERCHGNGRVELLEHCPECLGTGSGDIKEKINLLMRRKYPMAGTVWLIRCESYGWGPDAKPIETGWRVKTSWPGPNYIGESIYRDEFAESLPELAAKLRSE